MNLAPAAQGTDPQQTAEWLDALRAVVAGAGPERAHWLLQPLRQQAQRLGVLPNVRPFSAYRNTIPVDRRAVGGQGLCSYPYP